MQRLGLHQRLSVKISPQQIQFIKLLQVSAAELEARINEELEENPALDSPADTPHDDPTTDEFGDEPTDTEDFGDTSEGLDDESMDDDPAGQETSLDDYLAAEEEAGSQAKDYQPDDPNEERYEVPIVQTRSLYEYLFEQVDFLGLDDYKYFIAQQIIGNIDDDGYLRRPIESIVDDLAFHHSLTVADEDVQEVLREIQKLDPPGIGARDLRECLLIQLARKKSTPVVKLARLILEECFEAFEKKHFDKIMDKLDVETEYFREAYNEILHLNPKPGLNAVQERIQVTDKKEYIIPDFILKVKESTNDNASGVRIEVTLNRRNAPELRLNRKYKELYKEMEQEARQKKADKATQESFQFVKGKLESALWFIDALKQRQFTLLNTMKAIARRQEEFFIQGEDEGKLKPMILKDIAEEIGMDISTVSRVANSKYVQTDHAIYPLKFFFSEGIRTEEGDEVSNREVKQMLREFIEGESKTNPLSDEKLTDMLKERGYEIARRTVAKYREQLNIPVARLRKQM